MSMELIRLSVNMNTETAAALKQLAARDDVTVTEEVRRAVGVKKFISDEQLKGRIIIVEDRDGGNRRELVLLP